MFATPHYMDVMPEGSRKRQRDETDLASASPGFAEHRNVRIYPLNQLSTAFKTNTAYIVETRPMSSSPILTNTVTTRPAFAHHRAARLRRR